MSFRLFQIAATGQVGRYATIERQYDGRVFNGETLGWDDPANFSDQNKIQLDELDPVSEPGRYSADIGVELADDNYKLCSFYDTENEENHCSLSHKTTDKTALDMINELKRRLRFPEVSALTDPHSKQLLDFCNTIQRDTMTEEALWQEVYHIGDFQTVAGKTKYMLNFMNLTEIDAIRSVYDATEEPYNEILRLTSNLAPPEYETAPSDDAKLYNVQFAAGELRYLQLYPEPVDGDRKIQVSLYRKPRLLERETDSPELDSETIILGAYALALDEQGNDTTAAWEVFHNKLKKLSDHQGDTFFSDFEMRPV